MFWEQEHKLIEAEYLRSWDHIEGVWKDWLNRGRDPFTADVILFIWQLREKGYDRQLWASQATDIEGDGWRWPIMTLCRSAYYGLRDDQPRLDFVLMDEDRIDIRFRALHVNFMQSVKYLEFTPEIEYLLALLLAHRID